MREKRIKVHVLTFCSKKNKTGNILAVVCTKTIFIDTTCEVYQWKRIKKIKTSVFSLFPITLWYCWICYTLPHSGSKICKHETKDLKDESEGIQTQRIFVHVFKTELYFEKEIGISNIWQKRLKMCIHQSSRFVKHKW